MKFREKHVSTGCFGRARTHDLDSRITKVHIVRHGKPICGSKVGEEMIYQWCAPFVEFRYLSCKHCIKIAKENNYDTI